MEWTPILAAVPAVSASVAVLTALSTWWKARTWSSLADARDLLREIGGKEDPLLGEEVTDTAAKAATVVTLELTARAQQRAKKVAKRNGTARFVFTTIAMGVGFILIAAICAYGLILGFGGTVLGGSDVPTWGAIVYFGVFGAMSLLGGVMGTVERVQIWRQTKNKRALYKQVATAPSVKRMSDTQQLQAAQTGDPQFSGSADATQATPHA